MIGVGVFVFAASLLLLFSDPQRLTIYNKDFHVLNVEYNQVNVVSDTRFKGKLVLLLSKLGVSQRILAKVSTPPRNFVQVGNFASSHDIFKVYFRSPDSFDELTNFYAELVDERGNTTRLLPGARSDNPNTNEKHLEWRAARGATDSTSLYTMRIIKAAETNATVQVDIKLGRLNNLTKNGATP